MLAQTSCKVRWLCTSAIAVTFFVAPYVEAQVASPPPEQAGSVKAQAEATNPNDIEQVGSAGGLTDAGVVEESNTGADIVVTGSRVARAGYQAPTPTTIIDQTQLQAAPQANIANYVNQLPAVSNSTTPRTTGPGVGGGTGGANFLNLRSLGVNRTLVLLDGRRVVASATSGAVDINMLPTTLIQRVDVVTGGASAAWGSDAVAGVVNFVLDTRFSGVKTELQTGISDRGDGRETKFEVAAGTDFAGGKGHIIASGSYLNVSGIDRADSREWYNGTKVINNPGYVAGNGQPSMILAPNVGLSQATDGGLITSGPLRGTQFGPGGTTQPFNFGFMAGPLQVGGTPNDIAGRTQLQAPLTQETAFARASYDVANDVTVYGEFNYGHSLVNYVSVPYFRFNNITVRRDNAYLPATVAQGLDAAGASSFVMGRTNYDMGSGRPRNDRTLTRYLGGIDAKLGGTWKLQAYYQHGDSDVTNEVRNDAIVANYNRASDAVRNPSNGQIVCRSALTNPLDGCVPLNLFGFGAPSRDAIDYVNGTALQDITLKQDVASVSIRGDAFNLPGGAVSFAGGVEYRREAYKASADNISIGNGFWLGNYKPGDGSYNVKEAFGEVVIPVLKSLRLMESLDFNGAVRVTDYSTSGTVVTWKAGATWDVGGGLRLRGTRSRDIRAPNLNDLFLGGQTNQSNVVDPFQGNQSVSFLRVTKGNTDLRPEVANTVSGGIVYQPRWFPGANLSIDYYKIKIGQAIATLTDLQIVQRCFAGNTALCGFITRDANGMITQVIAQPINFRREGTSGVDFEASYRSKLGNLLPGSVTVRALGNYTKDRFIDNDGLIDSQLGEYGQTGPSRWRGLASLTYDDDSFNTTARARYIGSGVIDAAYRTGVDISRNRISPITYVDLSVTFKVKAGDTHFEVYGSAENLFDQNPRVSPMLQGGLSYAYYGVSPSVYDVVGRFYRTGVRVRF